MAIGASAKGRMNTINAKPTMGGSCFSEWVVANSNLAATQSATELLRPGATDDSNVVPIEIPEGATRVLLRTRRVAAATTLTTDPVIRLWGIDDDGLGTYTGTPTRLDSADSNNAGLTVAASASDASDSAAVYLYSDVSDQTGYDCLGCKWLFVLVNTAANYSASTSVAALVRFLN
jgi:hypothetical protein